MREMHKKEIVQRILDWMRRNRLALLYPVLAFVIEMTAVFAVEKNPFFTRPFLFLGTVLLFTGVILLFTNNRVRLAIGSVLLAVQE